MYSVSSIDSKSQPLGKKKRQENNRNNDKNDSEEAQKLEGCVLSQSSFFWGIFTSIKSSKKVIS